MNFSWINFPEHNYNLYLGGKFAPFNCIGSIGIGDICIDLINHTKSLQFDFYVAHEDTGYGDTEDGIPYSYAEGINIDIPVNIPYETFKAESEEAFEKYISEYNVGFSLLEHANKPLEIW